MKYNNKPEKQKLTDKNINSIWKEEDSNDEPIADKSLFDSLISRASKSKE